MPLDARSHAERPHLENLVLTNLLAWRDIQARRPEILYWRTATGEEVDFVIETPSRVIPIEVKSAPRISPSDAHGLESCLTEYETSSDGRLILYGDNDIYPLTKRVLAVPW